MSMRVAFTITKLGPWWTGGVNYFINLISALQEIPGGSPVEPVFFAGLNTDTDFLRRLTPYLTTPPIIDETWTPGSPAYRQRSLQALLLQRDRIAEKAFAENEIDIVFQFFAWYGFSFSIPTLAWIADFQHRHLPEMFSRTQFLKRELGYKALARSSSNLLVSSEDARSDCETFYPKSKGKVKVLPFAVRVGPDAWCDCLDQVKGKYNLPSRYIFLPNQFWKHKNHLAVLDALHILKRRGKNIVIVSTGNMHDNRNPVYIARITDSIRKYNLENNFITLGAIPFSDIYPLMRAAIAVLNPSLFEGWSTTVEEAKSLGVPLILSNLRVHKEQSPEECLFFNPYDSDELANVLLEAHLRWEPGPHHCLENKAKIIYPNVRESFARNFVDIVAETAKSCR